MSDFIVNEIPCGDDRGEVVVVDVPGAVVISARQNNHSITNHSITNKKGVTQQATPFEPKEIFNFSR